MAKILDKKVVFRLKCERGSNCLDMPKGADQRVTKIPVQSCLRCDFAIVEIISIDDYKEEIKVKDPSVPAPDIKSVVEKRDELGLG